MAILRIGHAWHGWICRALGPGVAVLALVVLTALLVSGGSVRAQTPPLEYAVKANFLYKFGPFVEWPPLAFQGPGSAFNICISGADPFGATLDDAVRGQTVEGHPVVVHRLRTVAANPSCHVLYIGRQSEQKAADVLRLVRGTPVLTVTDEQLGTSGGIIHFVLRQGRVRFGVDPGAAQAAGLTMSSKLLGLAVPVGAAG
jgi:hypothetical protein